MSVSTCAHAQTYAFRFSGSDSVTVLCGGEGMLASCSVPQVLIIFHVINYKIALGVCKPLSLTTFKRFLKCDLFKETFSCIFS